MIKGYEMVIGIEVHVELKTNTKIFCACSTKFGAPPNSQCCPVCMGMPGTLPVLNKKVVEYAIKAGLATNCKINNFSKNDRKNYFYPDLPKAYQVSQFDLPLCYGGYLDIELEEGTKQIGITRIHIEEDAGKLMHDEEKGTLIDLNRAGVPLIEIVSEPDIRSAEEAVAYLQKLRAVILYTGISDVKMNEGSFRADINLSVRKKGSEEFGTRAELKNLNSFQFIAKAIEYEYARQVEAVENGETLVQETRRFDIQSKKTYSMRTKADADDYRYFPDPDLMPIISTSNYVEEIKGTIPALPDERKKTYISKYGLSSDHAEELVVNKTVSDYFEEGLKYTQNPAQLASLIISEVFRLMALDDVINIKAEDLAEIANMLEENKINGTAAKKIISYIWENGGKAKEIAEKLDLWQLNDEAALTKIVKDVLAENIKIVTDYKNGKERAVKALLGKAMAKTSGKANPPMLNDIMIRELKNC